MLRHLLQRHRLGCPNAGAAAAACAGRLAAAAAAAAPRGQLYTAIIYKLCRGGVHERRLHRCVLGRLEAHLRACDAGGMQAVAGDARHCLLFHE